MIEIEKLGFRYPATDVPALHDLTLKVPAGSIFGLLGPNGSGKTTLISILAGLLPAPKGSVRVDGRDLSSERPAIQEFSSLVPQEYAFYPRLSVLENLEFFAGVQSIPSADRASRIAEVVGVAGLSGNDRKRSDQLSGGMKRRLNIAIGLLKRPHLLFLDEPTVGIDPPSRRFILEAVRMIQKRGATVVYSSHYMEEVESICDEIAVLEGGRLRLSGSLPDVLKDGRGTLDDLFSDVLQRSPRDGS